MTEERLTALAAEYTGGDALALLRQVEREAFAEGMSAHEQKRTASREQFQRVHKMVLGFKCCCGQRKTAGFPFCLSCRAKVPKDLQLKMYPAYRHIFALAYLEAECLLGFTEAVQEGAVVEV